MSFHEPTGDRTVGPTPEEIAVQAAELLAQLEPGRQPLPLFKELSRLMVMSTFEITPFRPVSSGVQVLLAQRPESDLWWPSLWHLPGSVQMPTAVHGIRSYEDAADDVLNDDFMQTVKRTSEVTIYDAQIRTAVRGSEQTVFGWTEVELSDASVNPVGGRFFDVESVLRNPPQEGFVIGHDQTLETAYASYQSRNPQQ